MFGLGVPELVVILAIVLVIFGPKRVPEFLKNLGGSIKDFRKSMKEADRLEKQESKQ